MGTGAGRDRSDPLAGSARVGAVTRRAVCIVMRRHRRAGDERIALRHANGLR
jgi:hypothetical protein